MDKLRFVYFGGEPLGVPVLEELLAADFVPELVVTSPDRPFGRKQVLTPPPVKVLAEKHGIEVIQPHAFSDKTAPDISRLIAIQADLFVVVAYNKILPEWLINLPQHKTLNVHPSLLPLLRGASPIRSAILEDMREELGVSVMQLDQKMDHGPVVSQVRLPIPENAWPMKGPVLDGVLAREGGRLLAATLPGYLSGDLTPQEQEHEYATYTTRFTTEDGLIDFNPMQPPTGVEAYNLLLKVCALSDNPGVFFMHHNSRIKINDAHLTEAGQFEPTQITPAGKNRQAYADWKLNNCGA